jgi:carboxyl-terminal processing protease
VAAAAATGAAAEPIESAHALETFDSAWTRIARTHYDSTFRGLDWNAVRTELRPRAGAARTTGELRAVINEMLQRIGESHYGLIPREVTDAVTPVTRAGEGGGDVGIELRMAEGRIVVWRIDAGGPAAAAGVRTGWIVHEIDTRRVDEELQRLVTLQARAQQIARTQFLMSLNAALEGPPGAPVRLRFTDGNDQPAELTLVRRTRPGQPVRFGNLPTMLAQLSHTRVTIGDSCVGVIRFNIWMVSPLSPAFDRAIDEVRGCAGIVVDVRGNPGGVAGMVMGVAGHFVADERPIGILRQRTTELRLKANPRLVNTSGQRVTPFAGPLAILIDGLSVSTSEIFAAGMQHGGRARVFGDTSAGQALPATAARLPNRDVLMHVVADLTAPDGTRIEGRGVIPDQPVPLQRADLLAGRDAALEAAVAWILAARTSSL